LSDQLFAVEPVEFLGLQLSLHFAGQQLARFEGQELGGHHQVFARHTQVVFLGQVQELQVLVGNFRHGNRARIELLVVNQIEQKIQRPRKHVEGHRWA